VSELEMHEEAPEQSEMAQWANDATQIARMATSLVQTSFVPQSMRGKPSEATAAILTGMEVGLRPMSALRSIDVINGVPALRAVTLRALVQSRGHEIWVEESTRTRAVVRGRRQGSEITQESVWTTDRAKDLGLMGKDNWKKQPQAMLIARATSELCRLIAADVILGLPYSIEELADDVESKPEPKKPATKRTAKRKSVDEPVADTSEAVKPEAEQPPADEGAPDPWKSNEPAT
jgi:hypothetical protein